MSEPIVSLRDVSKTYKHPWTGKSFTAIRNINLTIQPGESVGFIGHNGAGKSSTIRILMGLQPPTTGSVHLNGLPAEDPESRRGVSYVPETPLSYDYLTPLEIVENGLAMSGRRFENQHAQAMRWLELLGIAAAAGKPLRQLSKGMVQRTMLAHALAPEPHFVVLDEPLSGLDPVGRAEVVDILQDYRRGGGALLFSSHILSDIERLADRFVFIHRGEIRAVCSVYEILREAVPLFEVLADLPAGGADDRWSVLAGESLWRRSVTGDELADLLASVGLCGGRVLSVRNLNSLESVYLRLIKEAG